MQTATSQKQKQAYSLRGFKVLIAEDYPFMADLMSTMLREFGVGNILQAISGNEAREMLTLFNSGGDPRSAIDLVIVDWLMPEGDGPGLIKWIRDNRRDSIRFLPAVLCSAYASEQVVTTARDCGVNEALVKPVSAEKLARRMLHVIDNPRPFIKSPDFFGPERRRKTVTHNGEERRTRKAEEVKEFHERI